MVETEIMVCLHILIKARCITFTSGGWKSYDGKTVVTDGKWHYITTTYEQPNLTLYIDGKVDGKQEPNAVPDTPRNKFFIGGCDLDGAGY